MTETELSFNCHFAVLTSHFASVYHFAGLKRTFHQLLCAIPGFSVFHATDRDSKEATKKAAPKDSLLIVT